MVSFFDFLGSLALFPGECPACGEDGKNNLCRSCLDQLPSALLTLPKLPQFVSSGRVMSPYSGPVGNLLRCAKYRPDEKACVQLASLLSSRIDGLDYDPDVVVGVPQSSLATLKRGFSPVDCVAKAVGKKLMLQVKKPVWRRSGIAVAGVEKSARGHVASSLYWPVQGQTIEGRVLLVDDVITTGSTASAVAQVLLEQGAESVHLVALSSPAVA